MWHRPALAVLVLLAGCAGSLPGVQEETPCPPPDEPHCLRDAPELTVRATADGPVGVELLAPNRSAVFADRASDGVGVFEPGEAREPYVEYRLVVRRNGSVVWNRSVSPYEGFVLEVTDENVTKTDDVVV